jgi:riboflavin transporter
MVSKTSAVRELSTIAGLASISAIVQINHIGYQSPTWGMWIDIVAVSWVMAYFLLGFRGSFLVSVLGAIMITIFAPETWLGAVMKFVATMSVISTLSLIKWFQKSEDRYTSGIHLVVLTIISLVVRAAIVIPINYFVAIPIWTKMTPSAAWDAIPWQIIFGFNTFQTIIDISLAWLLVYRFKLNRYAKQTNLSPHENDISNR